MFTNFNNNLCLFDLYHFIMSVYLLNLTTKHVIVIESESKIIWDSKIYEIFVNLTCIKGRPVYCEHNRWSQGSSDRSHCTVIFLTYLNFISGVSGDHYSHLKVNTRPLLTFKV